jgi:NADH-quinone oxidoreductase subunit H
MMLEALIKTVLVILGLLMGAAYLVLLERKIAAWVQDRLGPNRVGIPLTKIRIFGLGQPIADGVKFIFKEEFTPSHVAKFLYFLAPIATLTAALAVFAVVPFGSVLPLEVGGEPIRLVIAPGVDVGMLFIFAVGGLAVYGVVLGGWSSNNKYSFFGGLRSSAQLISYEIPLGLGVLGVILMSGSLRLDTIIGQQAESGVWNVFVQPLGFVVFLVAAFAESGRLPFDLTECEQELVGGYHTEFSGMKLMMFLVGEYLHMIAASFLIVILFLGGWHFWFLTGSNEVAVSWLEAILRVLVLLGKVFFMVLFFMVSRWSWPRFRFDQLMAMAWKVMLPLGLVNVVVVGAMVESGDQLGGMPVQAAAGWLVLVGSWLLVGMTVPPPGRDRPVLELRPTVDEPEAEETAKQR